MTWLGHDLAWNTFKQLKEPMSTGKTFQRREYIPLLYLT